MVVRRAISVLIFTLTFWANSTRVIGAENWRIFSLADSLGESACRFITLGPGGNALVTHPDVSVLTLLDGYAVTNIPAPPVQHVRIYESPSGQLWAMSPGGLLEFRGTNWAFHSVPEFAASSPNSSSVAPVTLLPVRQGRVLVLSSERLLQFDTESVTRELFRADAFPNIGHFCALSRARDGSLWLAGERGVVKILGSWRSLHPDSQTQEFIPPADWNIARFVSIQDIEGGFACFAETKTGAKLLVEFSNGNWSEHALPDDTHFAWRGAETEIWFANSNAVFQLHDANSQPPQREEIPTGEITDVAVEPDGAFWIASSKNLLRHAPAIWTTRRTPAPRERNSAARRANQRLREALPEEVAAREQWNVTFAARNGDLWLGGEHEIAWRRRGAWTFFSSTNQLGPENVIGFAEAPDGQMVCATPEKVWEFDGRNWLTIHSGFGRVNDLCYARDGTLWLATDSGLYRRVRGSWLRNDEADGLPSAVVNSVRELDIGAIIVATPAGEMEFQPEADRDPPETFIRPLLDDEQTVREGNSVTLTFGGHDKWNVTPRSRLLFSYRLDEREWSPFQDTAQATFGDLGIGKHYFQVRAMDRNANVDSNPARLEFAVVIPWYHETRLVWILCVALAVAIFFAALAFNRHRRLLHSYTEVERQIAERTRELELANRELVHSQKMNALGTLAAGIAHDFNNILSIVKGSAQIIEENLDRPEKIQTRLDRIKLVVQQGAGIVEAMLGFGRSSDSSAGAGDVNAVVEDTVKLLGDRFVREVDVRFEREEDLPEISAPRDFVQQVLLNFIFNAREAMERRIVTEGGAKRHRDQISLATRLVKILPAGMALSPSVAAEYVAVSVSDSGCGIAADVLPRIFEPFFTTKALSARRGTGLGLSMAYELAKKMSAGLSVETVVGQGSTFTIFFPVIRETQSTSTVSTKAVESS